MIYNPRRQRIMIAQGDPGPIMDDWEFDGSNWLPLVEPVVPPPQSGYALGFDGNDNRVLRTLGFTAETDTWAFIFSSTVPNERCDGGMDEDGDGLVDCDDLDCDGMRCGAAAMTCEAGACTCSGGSSEIHCGDAFDDDCDGAIDCADDDCQASVECTAESDCQNGSDDDGDQRADCADPGCIGVGVCEAYEQSCTDGEDNDGDGNVDCADLDCFLNPCAMVVP